MTQKPDEDFDVAKLQRELASSKSIIRRLLKKQDTADTIRRALFNLTKAPSSPCPWEHKPPRHIKTPGVPMTIWSDWHWGETVDPLQVGGVNAFNREIAQQRVKTLVDKTITLCKDHMVRPEYPGIVVCLGGDMITGAIHEELAETNWTTPHGQFLEVQDALTNALATIADTFGNVFIPCVVGNHGRDTLKPRFKGTVQHSLEWNLYHQLARTFRGDRRFRFAIPAETDISFKVYGHRYLLTHGDMLGVKGGDGIIGAIGPIARGATKVGRSEAQIGRDFDTIIIGHWHSYLPANRLTPAIVNGALKGYDEYARLKLRVPYSPASQALWFVHPDHGITAQWEIFVDKQRSTTESSEWITWQEPKSN